jgi:hypothetical protein
LASWSARAQSNKRVDATNSRTKWLSNINDDGSPHVTAVGALWVDGTFCFQTGRGTRKGRNVARDPRCSVAVSIRYVERVGNHCPVQSTVARATAMERLPHRAAFGDRGLGDGAGRPDAGSLPTQIERPDFWARIAGLASFSAHPGLPSAAVAAPA